VNWYQGSYACETDSAAARLHVTPVNARATIEMKIPVEWMIPWDPIDDLANRGADILVDYVLVADGTPLEGDLSEQSAGGGTRYRWSLSCHQAMRLCSAFALSTRSAANTPMKTSF
jgi:hypothetical protein